LVSFMLTPWFLSARVIDHGCTLDPVRISRLVYEGDATDTCMAWDLSRSSRRKPLKRASPSRAWIDFPAEEHIYEQRARILVLEALFTVQFEACKPSVYDQIDIAPINLWKREATGWDPLCSHISLRESKRPIAFQTLRVLGEI
jgi:hypothetical protein